jgi:hypothetical protein
LERLAEAQIIPTGLRDGVKRIVGEAQSGRMLTYLAHEYLNEHWRPVYHADVARSFAAAKLSFVGSADYLKNFSNFILNEKQLALLAEFPTSELRETLKDFATGHGMRVDIFVRGARRMSDVRRNALLGEVRLALLRPPPEAIELPGPDQTVWRAHPGAYRRFMQALETRPHSVAELLALPALPASHGVSPAELVGVLVGTAIAHPFRDADAAARASCVRLNRLIEAEGEISFSRTATIAVASLATGMLFSSGDFDLYLSLRRGERPNPKALAAHFVARCKAHGGYPIVDGRTLQNEAEAHDALTRDYVMKIDRFAPLWSKAGVFDTTA